MVAVVSITGLQCTGKTTLARALSRALDAVVISRDPLMDVLQEAGVPLQPSSGIQGIGEIGYSLQGALLRELVGQGRSVVLDCIVDAPTREEWRRTAAEGGARFWLVDTICSDADVHRDRYEARGLVQRGTWKLTWSDLERYRTMYRTHPQAHYVADAIEPVAAHVERILALMES